MGRIARKSNKTPPYIRSFAAELDLVHKKDQERSTTNKWVVLTISLTREPHNQYNWLKT
jgi:hypothetical protein